MKHLIIVGARGWGREVAWLAEGCIGYGTDFDIKGFLDDKADALDGLGVYPPILGSVETYNPQSDDVFTVALGVPAPKKKYVEILKQKNVKFINLISKRSAVHKTAKLGEGCILDWHVSLSANTTVGDFVTIQRNAVIGHDATIGNYCMLNCFSFMGGYASIGDESELATHAQILPHGKVGNKCMVGAGSVVLRKVKDNTSVFGVPAIPIDY